MSKLNLNDTLYSCNFYRDRFNISKDSIVKITTRTIHIGTLWSSTILIRKDLTLKGGNKRYFKSKKEAIENTYQSELNKLNKIKEEALNE